MIQLKQLAAEVSRVYPNIVLGSYDRFLLAHKQPHIVGKFDTLQDQEIDVPWIVVWIDCHASLVEIRGFGSFGATKQFLIGPNCPIISTTCGGFVVLHGCKAKLAKLFFVAPNGDEVVYDSETSYQRYWGLKDVLSIQLELIDN